MLFEGQSILPKALTNDTINYLMLGLVDGRPNLRYTNLEIQDSHNE